MPLLFRQQSLFCIWRIHFRQIDSEYSYICIFLARTNSVKKEYYNTSLVQTPIGQQIVTQIYWYLYLALKTIFGHTLIYQANPNNMFF